MKRKEKVVMIISERKRKKYSVESKHRHLNKKAIKKVVKKLLPIKVVKRVKNLGKLRDHLIHHVLHQYQIVS